MSSQTNKLVIKNKKFGEERALYNSNNLELINVSFEGKEDGESALKESSNVSARLCKFVLRYPLWHVNNADILDSTFEETCRAAFWYGKNINIKSCTSKGPKFFRECNGIRIFDSRFDGAEPFWKSNNISITNSMLDGEYAFLQSKDIAIDNVTFKGKYAFQYCENLFIKDSILNTKDAFWHCNNVTCVNCTIKGEYIGWYAKKVKLVNCVIESHQPFCYTRDLLLIDCKMSKCDLAFEYSIVNGNIVGEIESIKNPLKGKIVVDNVKEIIKDNCKYKCKAKIITNKKVS